MDSNRPARPCQEGTSCADAAVVQVRAGARRRTLEVCDQHAHALVLEDERYGASTTIRGLPPVHAPAQR